MIRRMFATASLLVFCGSALADDQANEIAESRNVNLSDTMCGDYPAARWASRGDDKKNFAILLGTASADFEYDTYRICNMSSTEVAKIRVEATGHTYKSDINIKSCIDVNKANRIEAAPTEIGKLAYGYYCRITR